VEGEALKSSYVKG